jgi:hypothetical protein
MAKSKYKITTVRRLVPQELLVTEFPGFRLIEGNDWPLGGGEFGYGIRDEDYEALLEKSLGNTDFLFEPWEHVPRNMRYVGVTDEYVSHYVHLPQYAVSDHYEEMEIRELAKRGAFQNIVADEVGDDGYLYALNGHPVYRSFSVELPVGWGFSVDKLYKRLSREFGTVERPRKFGEGTTRLGNLRLRDVPYYNQESSGRSELCFNFYPADQWSFEQLYESDKADCTFGARDRILEILGIDLPKYEPEDEFEDVE